MIAVRTLSSHDEANVEVAATRRPRARALVALTSILAISLLSLAAPPSTSAQPLAAPPSTSAPQVVGDITQGGRYREGAQMMRPNQWGHEIRQQSFGGIAGCLEVTEEAVVVNGQTVGLRVQSRVCDDHPNQSWGVFDDGAEGYTIRSRPAGNPELCLQAVGCSTEAGADTIVEVRRCNGSSAQRWTIEGQAIRSAQGTCLHTTLLGRSTRRDTDYSCELPPASETSDGAPHLSEARSSNAVISVIQPSPRPTPPTSPSSRILADLRHGACSSRGDWVIRPRVLRGPRRFPTAPHGAPRP